MDRKSVIVLIACAALFVVWSVVTPRLYPPKPFPRTNAVAQVTNVPGADPSPAVTSPGVVAAGVPSFVPPAADAPEELLVLSNANTRITFTSHGAGIRDVELLKYADSVSCGRKRVTATNRVASLNAEAQEPVLALLSGGELASDGVYKLFRASRPANARGAGGEVIRAEKLLSNQLFLTKEFELSSNYLIHARVRIENRSEKTVSVPAQQWVAGTATPLNPQDDEQNVRITWYNGSKEHRADSAYFLNRTLGCFPGTPRAEYRAGGEPVAWTTAQNQFFLLALIPAVAPTEVVATKYTLPPPSREEILADSKTLTNQFALQVLVSQPGTNLAPGLGFEREFTIYAGPKEYRTLERIGAEMKNNLDSAMGFGWPFGFFSKLLLLSMNGLYALGLSYGMAIIAITVIIKLLFWPLTQASTRSMKRMQTLQPQMKAIQEKFKDDPAKMNKKMMEFMRENKVSPLGGCLPLLLQVPVFIGFFQMVQSAIELRGARFLWACDLSKPDTVFVIPGLDFNVNPLALLMGATMFWQAGLTPPSPGMDPAQQKIMKYFPLIFLFILYNYSAGLTLYWTVQNLLSIAQMKLTRATENKTVAPGKAPVPAPARPKKK